MSVCHNFCYISSIFDIVSDILLVTTYLKVETVIKTVPMKNDTLVMNTTGRICTFVEENGDLYNFSCEEYNPMFASLTLTFIYMPSLNVLATLYGPTQLVYLALCGGR